MTHLLLTHNGHPVLISKTRKNVLKHYAEEQSHGKDAFWTDSGKLFTVVRDPKLLRGAPQVEHPRFTGYELREVQSA